ncbi:MAG: erythromycin esterase family protein, partial [Anaerolineae bacterium]|nr:erythromycin esterase family protein [Anaerolineae bacterium]
VALGEATHGTHEFFTMKHRLFEFLVQEMGFTIFAMEANWPEAERVNGYVQTGEGDPAALLAGMYFWVWNTQEVLDLIEWLRDYNVQRGDRPAVHFTGFDAQYPDVAAENVLAYLDGIDASAAALAGERYSCLELIRESLGMPTYSQLPRDKTEAYHDDLQAVYEDMLTRRDRYAAATSPEAFAAALQNARIVVQSEDIFSGRPTGGTSARDRYMAENVTWLLERAGPDAKIILWAHNGHIWESRGWDMGMWLDDDYGTEYVSVGFAFDHGSFNAREMRVDIESESVEVGDLQVFEVGPAPDEAVGAYLRQAGLPAFWLDLRDIGPGDDGAQWLRNGRSFRNVGSVYDPDRPDSFMIRLATLSTLFDFLIFFEDITPSILLPMDGIVQ